MSVVKRVLRVVAIVLLLVVAAVAGTNARREESTKGFPAPSGTSSVRALRRRSISPTDDGPLPPAGEADPPAAGSAAPGGPVTMHP